MHYEKNDTYPFFSLLFLLVLSQCFRFDAHHTKRFVYPPFNWYCHIRVNPIYLSYPMTYMTVYSWYSVGQTHLSPFPLQNKNKRKKTPKPAFFNTRLLCSPKGTHLLTLRTVALLLTVHKNDNSCNFPFTRTITLSHSEDSRCFNHRFFLGNLNRK